MAEGAITATNLGVVNITGGALKTLLDAQSTTGTSGKRGDLTQDIIITHIGNGQVHVTKISRATS